MLEQYRKATRLALMGLWDWDIPTNEVNWSDEKFILFGYEPQEFELTLESAFKTVHPDDVQLISDALDANLPTKEYFDYSYRGIKKNGDIIHVWVRVNVVRNEAGEPVKVYGISQDRTAQVEMENQIRTLNKELRKNLQLKSSDNELLVKEMHHRVKNNLQVISSILNLQKIHVDDEKAKEILDLCVKRIKSMAIIHDSLYSNSNHSNIVPEKYIQNLVELYKSDKVNFHIDVNSPTIGLDVMVPVALIVNELIANSCNHAFKEEEKGDIFIDLKNSDKFILNYRDTGIGMNMNQEKTKSSFGLEMIETLCKGMEGEYELSSHPGEGMEFHCEMSIN